MNTVTRADRLGKHVEALPGYAAWLQEQDHAYWIGVLRDAASKHLLTLPACDGCGRCERCQLDEAIAYTEPGPERGIDLLELQRASEGPLPAA